MARSTAKQSNWHRPTKGDLQNLRAQLEAERDGFRKRLQFAQSNFDDAKRQLEERIVELIREGKTSTGIAVRLTNEVRQLHNVVVAQAIEIVKLNDMVDEARS
jgi:hypothetical protein